MLGSELRPVVDVDGEPLRYGVDYFVVSAIRGAGGGGLSLAGISCPLSVKQERIDLMRGIPVKFLAVDVVGDNVVRESTDLNVKFNIQIQCEEATVWRVGRFEGLAEWVVRLGGVEGYHGPGTADSLFKIQRAGGPSSSYLFRFCPSKPRTFLIPCGDVGVHSDPAGIRRLVLSDSAKTFVFVRADRVIRDDGEIVM